MYAETKRIQRFDRALIHPTEKRKHKLTNDIRAIAIKEFWSTVTGITYYGFELSYAERKYILPHLRDKSSAMKKRQTRSELFKGSASSPSKTNFFPSYHFWPTSHLLLFFRGTELIFPGCSFKNLLRMRHPWRHVLEVTVELSPNGDSLLPAKRPSFVILREITIIKQIIS